MAGLRKGKDGRDSTLTYRHEDDEYFFHFHLREDGSCFDARYRPGETALEEVHLQHVDWSKLKDEVEQWAINIKPQIDEPDLWGAFARASESYPFEASPITDDTPISAAEAASLREGLKIFEQRFQQEFRLNAVHRPWSIANWTIWRKLLNVKAEWIGSTRRSGYLSQLRWR